MKKKLKFEKKKFYRFNKFFYMQININDKNALKQSFKDKNWVLKII